MTKELNVELAQKLLCVVDAGLPSGLGKARPGQMCLEAAICYVLGEPHGDSPSCVHPVMRGHHIRLNDARWSTDTARAAGLRDLSVAQLGSQTVDAQKWLAYVIEQTIRRIVPRAMRAAASMQKEPHKSAMEAAALRCEQEGTREASLNARVVAIAAADAAANAAAAADAAANAAANADAAAANADAVANADAANAAANADAAAANADAVANADAADAAANADAAAANANANAAADAADAAANAARPKRSTEIDAILSAAALIAVEAYRHCGAPGVALLDQIEVAS